MKTKQAKKPNKLNIFINIAENSGVGYYRQFLLATTLREQGLANVLINDFTYGESRLFCHRYFPECKYVSFGSSADLTVDDYTKHLKEAHNKQATPQEQNEYRQVLIDMVEPDIQTLNKIGHWADIMVVGRRDSSNYLSQWKGMSQFFNIPVVIDTDDNVYATRPFNPGYRGYYPGSEALMWNKKTMQEVDAITVSTENLKNVHLKDNPNIYTIPNCLEFDRWKKAIKPEHKGEIRIGLLLSSAHHEDAKLLIPVLSVILKKYPQVKFYYTGIFSYLFADLQKNYPQQVIPINWIPLKSWPEEVVAQGFDIGLAPLADNMFNRAKSNLRFLEYSAAKMATVASPVEPYRNTITNKKDGFLASTTQEWIDYISELVEDEKLRQRISTNAFKLIEKNFDIQKSVKNALKVYQKIITDFRKKHGKRKFDLQQDAFKHPEKAHQVSALV